MTTTKPIKVSSLAGPALDWAVAKCDEGQNWILDIASFLPNHRLGRMAYSSDWSLAGPIIEREGISVEYGRADYKSDWIAYKLGLPYEDNPEGGPTPLVAAMRCYVASRLGDTVEIPEELI